MLVNSFEGINDELKAYLDQMPGGFGEFKTEN